MSKTPHKRCCLDSSIGIENNVIKAFFYKLFEDEMKIEFWAIFLLELFPKKKFEQTSMIWEDFLMAEKGIK